MSAAPSPTDRDDDSAARRDVSGGPGTAPDEPLLDVRNLKKYFPVKGLVLAGESLVVKAVDDASFSVRPGETLGIVGVSGCGKSTTARLVMRLIEPDSGAVELERREIGSASGMSLREARSRMQMVFQDSYSSLNPRLPVEDTIAFGPRVHGVPRTEARERARWLLSEVGRQQALRDKATPRNPTPRRSRNHATSHLNLKFVT